LKKIPAGVSSQFSIKAQEVRISTMLTPILSEQRQNYVHLGGVWAVRFPGIVWRLDLSDGSGVGIFAAEHISAGTCVTEYGGSVVNKEEFAASLVP
jgi:hypothetical protein